MRNERPDSIDALIDDAARRLVAGGPSSALRISVRERIGRRRPVWMFVPALAGAVALLVVSVIVGRALLGPPDGPDRVRPTNGRPLIERPAPTIASQRPDAPAIQPALNEARQFTRRLVTTTPPPPAEQESPIPPITIEPLTTVPLQAAQIAVDDSSGVTPIEIAPLQIEPLLGQ